MSFKSWLGPLFGVALAIVAMNARADEASEAELQYELGTQLYQQGKYAEAVQHFIASHRLVPNANVVFNIAQTFALMKRPVEAYNWYETYVGLAPDAAARSNGVKLRDELGAKVAVLAVTTTPPGAQLFVDRVELGAIGESPRRIATLPGDHKIIARLTGWRDASGSRTAALGEVAPVDIALARVEGNLQVQTTPPGAVVQLAPDGRELGRTPFSVALPAGEARLEIALAGWVTQSKTVEIRDSATTAIDVRLERAASDVAVLTVRGNVGGAQVMLDGRPLGNAPLTLPGLSPGRHSISIGAPGRDAWQGPLLLEPGAATRVDFTLVGPDDRAWPGWRWVGYGAGGALLAAGAVVGATALGARADFDAEPTREGLDRVESRNLAADVLMGSGLLVVGVTLAWDLLSGPAPVSTGNTRLER